MPGARGARRRGPQVHALHRPRSGRRSFAALAACSPPSTGERVARQGIELSEDLKARGPGSLDGPDRADLGRRLIEAAPDAVVVVDEVGRIVLVNAQTERLFGYRREELIGQRVEILLPGSLGPGHAGERARFLAAPRGRPMGSGLELRGRRRDGTECAVEISLSPLVTPGGVLVFASVRDIGDRRQRELELTAMTEHLSAVRASSRGGLAVRAEALRRAQRAAEAASAAKSELLAAMSHELRSPLNAILGFAQLVRRDRSAPLGRRQLVRVDRILEAGDQLLRRLVDLLEVARLDRGPSGLPVPRA